MKKLILTVIAGSALLAGCGTSRDSFVVTVPPAQAQGQVTMQQVEFLARPAIGEVLLFSNDLLNTYNAVGPSFVATALNNPNSPEAAAAAPIFAQATAVLNILTGLDPNNGPTTGEVVAGFLPDVMRIDTTLNVAVPDSAYNAAFNANGSLVGGRKLTDDVIDITLGYLTGGAVTTDNVPYYKPAVGPGSNNGGIGHQRLNGQSADFGTATFPFLAPAN